jgi:sucrose-6-phosphate hydrolase SacC (GH32 family)
VRSRNDFLIASWSLVAWTVVAAPSLAGGVAAEAGSWQLNWPGGRFFAPESLLDGKGRRIFWAWVTDPRAITTQQSTGSGVQSLPRVLSLGPDGTLRITPVEELQSLRRNHRVQKEVFANDRQCVTQQIFPSRKDSLGVRISARGGAATVRTLEAWDMTAARFVNRKRAG